MRRVSRGHGFLISLLINMAFRAEWLVIAIVLFVLNRVLGLSIWFMVAALAVWVIYSLVVTLLLSMANRLGNVKDEPKINKNPYSSGEVQKESKDLMCPCCGRYKFTEYAKYEICPICNWEDDPVSRRAPDFEGGANKLSLNQAREVYKETTK